MAGKPFKGLQPQWIRGVSPLKNHNRTEGAKLLLVEPHDCTLGVYLLKRAPCLGAHRGTMSPRLDGTDLRVSPPRPTEITGIYPVAHKDVRKSFAGLHQL